MASPLRNAKRSLRQSLRKALEQMTAQERKDQSLLLTERVICDDKIANRLFC